MLMQKNHTFFLFCSFVIVIVDCSKFKNSHQLCQSMHLNLINLSRVISANRLHGCNRYMKKKQNAQKVKTDER